MNIHPLGEHIIIRTVPTNSIGSIIVPDTAKGITLIGERGGADDSVHFVEAEVIAVGPGKRQKGDKTLVTEMAAALGRFATGDFVGNEGEMEAFYADCNRLLLRFARADNRIPPLVKPGDRILYHPAVQKFDRDITDVMVNGSGEEVGAKYFMIREDSVLAVIER